MEGIIIYESKYGATGQYVAWIAKSLACRTKKSDDVTTRELSKYDYVILATPVYMGKLLMTNWIRKHHEALNSKLLFILVVGATASSDKKRWNELIDINIPTELRTSANLFSLPGRLIKSKLNWIDRLLVRFGAMIEKDPVRKKAMLQDFDEVKEENIDRIMKTILPAIGKERSSRPLPAN